MNKRGRAAAVLAVGVGFAVGCGSFGSDDDKPDVTPSNSDGGAQEAASGLDGSDVDASRRDAGPERRGCDSVDAPAGRARQCWDFNTQDAGLAANVTSTALLELDPADFVSPPFSLRTRIPKSDPQQIARGVFAVPKLASGPWVVDMWLRVNDCQGGSTNDGGAPPSLLELYCYGEDDIARGAILRLERPDVNHVRVVAANLLQSGVFTEPIELMPPSQGWFHLVIEAPLFGHDGPLRVTLDGVAIAITPTFALQCSKDASSLQLLLGVQDSNASNSCDVHYDDVTFEYPR